MFKVHFPIDEIRRKVNATDQAIRNHQRDLNEAIGVQLLSFAKQDYRTKSRGGTGSDGITWKPLAPATIKRKNARGSKNSKRATTKGGKARPGIGSSAIGIDTGLQQNSATPGFTASDGKGGNLLQVTDVSVTVGFNRTYSEYFDAARPLLPTALPEAWQKKCEEIVTRDVERIIEEGLK